MIYSIIATSGTDTLRSASGVKGEFGTNALLVMLVVIVLPFILNLAANLISARLIKDKMEVSFRLIGWEFIAQCRKGGLEGLRLTYVDIAVDNILRLCWQIKNTGNMGIPKFEDGPAIIFPPGSEVIGAKLRRLLPANLRIGDDLLIEKSKNMVICDFQSSFNPGEAILIDIYIKNMPESIMLMDFVRGWDLQARALDLSVRKE